MIIFFCDGNFKETQRQALLDFFKIYNEIKTFTISKRYSEFEILYRKLVEEDETLLIPPLPEKNRDTNASNPKEQTILERKAGLERFLNKLVTHAQFRRSPAFRKFVCKVCIFGFLGIILMLWF
jgi:uncharacterized protein YydD (DUF2326 family)